MSQDELDELFAEESMASSSEEQLAISTVKDSGDEDEEAISEVEMDGLDQQKLENIDSITLPALKRPSSQGLIPYVLKLPGFINYKRGLYEGEASLRDELVETEFVDYGDLLRTRTTIRNKRNGSTNARLNRWSDGNWTLQIGSEHFEVLPQVFGTEENNSLFLRHQDLECLESVGKLANKLTVRPFMDSQGTHRKYLALAEATGKGMKKVKVRAATTIVDPEKEKRGLVKIQQERIKARRKLDAKRRNLEQKTYDRVGREGLTARFLEADEDDEEFDQPDEYDADFIDDGEIEEVDIDDDGESDDNSKPEEEERKAASDVAPSRTSRLIFDDDDDE